MATFIQRIVVGLVLLAPFGLAGCHNEEKDWVGSTAVADAYLRAVSTGDYAGAFDLHDTAYPIWNKPESKAEFVNAMTEIAREWPGVFAFTWELERLDGLPRARIYNHKAKLSWPYGNPAVPESARKTKSGSILPVIGPEMLLGTREHDGRWRVNIFGEYRPPAKLFEKREPPLEVPPPVLTPREEAEEAARKAGESKPTSPTEPKSAEPPPAAK